MKQIFVKKNVLSASIGLIVGGAVSAPSWAQEALEEEVVVTGIRGSLERALDIKREAKGVVDAISSEDIGKFPDSNLAESLQRITGVSISRSNNEGQQVSVRGMAPEFNMVTLNGRTMPTASDDRNAVQTRAFNFAELASESISGVNVYKTGKASQVTGGIGATIDIRTSRPLDIGETKLAGGFKAVFDQSNETGEDVTPEISGLYSDVFLDGKLGFLASFSYQERHNREYIAAIDGWLQAGVNTNNPTNWDLDQDGIFDDTNKNGIIDEADDTDPGVTINDLVNNGNAATFNEVNGLSEGDEGFRTSDVWFVPRNYNVGFADHERTRFNGSMVVQFAPTEEVTFTVDYVRSDFEDQIHRNQLGVWFANSAATVVQDLNANGTATRISENGGTLDVFGFANLDKSNNESLGFNVEWDLTDNFNLEFDAHNSTSEAGDDPQFGPGATTDQFLILGYAVSQGFEIPDGAEIPTLSGLERGPDGLTGTADDIVDVYDPSLIGTNLSFWNRNAQETEINEWRLIGDLALDSLVTNVKFGIGRIKHETEADIRANQQTNPGGVTALPDGNFSRFSVADEFSDFEGSEFLPDIFAFDTEVMIDAIVRVYDETDGIEARSIFLDAEPDQLHRLTEETDSAFVEVTGEYEFDDFIIQRIDVLAGLRYETTDVIGNSQQLIFTRLQQRSGTEIAELTDARYNCILQFPNEGSTEFAECVAANEARGFTDIQSDYDYLLPSLDISVNITDDLIARFSASNTIARSDLVQQRGTQSVTASDKGTFLLSEGNPGLLPYNSINLDVSLEWYYGDASYASIGFFSKDVTDFLATTTRQDTFNDIRDPSNDTLSPRATLAREELVSEGIETPDDTQIYTRMLANQQAALVANPGDANLAAFVENNTIISADDDPLAIWNVAAPDNGEEATLEGVEVAIQHLFGESGFGVIANATFVESNAEFDVSNTTQTFAITGLSDSANLVAFYDKYGFQARLAYNWRDEFLNGPIGQLRVQGEPTFTEEFGQFDLNISYDINENVTVFLEGLNITEEDARQHGRYEEQLLQAIVGSSRWNLGARANF